MDFLVKIRKRRERVHNKTLLEKSKFERELKMLECSINYEGPGGWGGQTEMWNARKRVLNEAKTLKLECSWS